MTFLFALFPLLASAASLEGIWTGRYEYTDGRPPVHFELSLQNNGSTFTGEVTEPKSFECQDGQTLTSTISGEATADGLRFLKSYSCQDGRTVNILYEGNGQEEIAGSWKISADCTGTFSMARARAPVELGCPYRHIESDVTKSAY